MARRRNSPKQANDTKPQDDVSTVSTQNVTTAVQSSAGSNPSTTTNTNKGASRVMASEVLTQDQIDALLSRSRPRGEGALVIEEFINSGQGGWKIDTESGPFKGKSAQQVFSSLGNARKKINPETKTFAIEGAERVRVMKNDQGVFLVNVGTAVPEE